MSEKIQWIESTRENFWQTSKPVETTDKQNTLIITNNKGRVVEGFGSCFNELGMHYFVNGANGYVYWNAVLEAKGRSTWGLETEFHDYSGPGNKKVHLQS